METKPGVMTTEFFLVLVPNLITIVNGLQGRVPDKWELAALTVLNGFYAALRTWLKKT